MATFPPISHAASSDRPSLQYKKVMASGLMNASASRTHPPLIHHLAICPEAQHIAGGFGHEVVIWQIDLDPDSGGYGAQDYQEKWDILTICHLNQLQGVGDFYVTCLTWASKKYFLFGSSSGEVFKLDKINRWKVGCDWKRFKPSTHAIKFLAMNRDGLLAVACGDHNVAIWVYDECSEDEDEEARWDCIHRLPLPSSRIGDGALYEVTYLGWNEALPDILVVSYLNHGILSWNASLGQWGEPFEVDKVYAGALSPDGRLYAAPGTRGAFDVFDLESKIRFRTLRDPEPVRNELPREKARPCQFVHDGEFLLGADIGRINLWHIATATRLQHLDLNLIGADQGYVDRPIGAFAISDTNNVQHNQIIRVAACSKGPYQDVEVWKAKVHSLAVQEEGRTAGARVQEEERTAGAGVQEEERTAGARVPVELICLILLGSLVMNGWMYTSI
ncbi:WD40-repeat-containing domain protein [Ephemerocybe angulata]|uniref:WD40-repeat-containing domain protein n=1 Tax=Ephemerocybe angulata TaxID=980116 RepID=A0A8H6I510_9AGAR|nr:WD40-repeat-containing domain protein [Tulosesus angulatus]